MSTENTCSFTGHRNIKSPNDLGLLKSFIESFIKEGYDTFLDGMAIGFDMIAAEAVISLMESYPHIKLIACVPCPGQDRYYSEEEKVRYAAILEKCTEVKVVCSHYYKGCMLTRDRYMVDNCSVVIAYNRGEKGGTSYTLGYAAQKKKKIYVI